MKLQVPPVVSDVPVAALQADIHAYAIEQNGKYLHWDELRRRPEREAISHEDWWALIKFARKRDRKTLPFADSHGKAFTFLMTDSVQRIAHEIDRDASGRIELPEDIGNPSTRDRYIVNSLVEEAFRSSQLEGASTTRPVAKEMIRSKRAPRTLSERMILNNFHAMAWVRDHQVAALTPALLCELHAIVTAETLDAADAAGRFRRADEPIHVVDPKDGETVHIPPDAALLPQRMAALCAFANGKTSDEPFVHPVVRAILVHFWLAYDHPFVDGNGRTARVLFYWVMLRQGYWLTEFLSISRVIQKARAQYDNAFLYAETDDNDATYFVINQLRVVRQAIDDLFVYLKRKARDLREVEQSLHRDSDLNHRQLAVLSHVARKPDSRLTIAAHQTSHRVVYQTARADLLDLVKRGFLAQRKVGKKMVFEPVANLQHKLGQGAR